MIGKNWNLRQRKMRNVQKCTHLALR